MKLIIWWVALMLILPLACLFWWKKRWRLLLGVIILAVLVISYLIPGEFAFSKLTTETEKEKPVKQLEEALKSISDDEIKPSDSEKTKCEKLIIRFSKEIKKLMEKEQRGEKLNETEISQIKLDDKLLLISRATWIKNWGKKRKSPTFLFCGEQFNEGLSREGENWEGKWQKVKSYNIIDFGQSENNKLKVLKKKLQEICEQNEREVAYGNSPIVWLKNIDKITNPEVKKELVKIVDPDQKNNLGEYYEEEKIRDKTGQRKKKIDLSRFTLVATTSATSPKLLPNELRSKLNHIEPFLEKHKWVIFFSSIGAEVIIFFLLIRSQRKSKDKSLKHLERY